MELGIYAFGVNTPDPTTGEQLSPDVRLRNLIELPIRWAWRCLALESTTGPTS
jgi:hypothetical protein